MDPLGEASSFDEATNASWPERMFVAAAMIGTAAMCVIVTTTVITRWLWEPIIPDDVLIVRELMVGVILLPLAAVTATRAHIAVTVFTRWMKPRGQAVLSALGHLVGLMFVCGLIWAGWRLFARAWASGDYFDGDIYIPMWIGYGVFLAALAAFALRVVIMLLRDVRAASRRVKA